MAHAEINIEILEDGTIKWTTGRIPDAHHVDADAFQVDLEAAAGGPVNRTSKAGKARHTHQHADGHIHTHE